MVTVGKADQGGTAVALGGVALLTSIQDNVFLVGIAVTGGFDDTPLLTAEFTVRDNLMVCRERGVELQGPVAHLFRQPRGRQHGAALQQRRHPAGRCDSPGHGCEVRENAVVVAGAGIAVGSSGFTVADNDVTGTPDSIESRFRRCRSGAVGVRLRGSGTDSDRREPGPRRRRWRRSRARCGQLARDQPQPGRARDARHRDGGAGRGVLGGRRRQHRAGRRIPAVGRQDGAFGIQLVGSTRAVVESNCVNGVGAAREVSGAAAGILVLGCPDSRVAGNSVDRIGMLEDPGEDVGIAVLGLIARTQVSGNQSRRQPSDIDIPTSFRGLLIGSQTDGREPAADLVAGYVVGNAAVPTVVGPFSVYTLELREAASVIVDTNIVSGGGAAPTAVVGVGRSDAILTGNQVRSRGEEPACWWQPIRSPSTQTGLAVVAASRAHSPPTRIESPCSATSRVRAHLSTACLSVPRGNASTSTASFNGKDTDMPNIFVAQDRINLEELGDALLLSRVSAKNRRHALLEIQRANPGLNFDRIDPGTVVVVPPVEGLKARSTEDPIGTAADDQIQRLTAGLDSLTAAAERGRRTGRLKSSGSCRPRRNSRHRGAGSGAGACPDCRLRSRHAKTGREGGKNAARFIARRPRNLAGAAGSATPAAVTPRLACFNGAPAHLSLGSRDGGVDHNPCQSTRTSPRPPEPPAKRAYGQASCVRGLAARRIGRTEKLKGGIISPALQFCRQPTCRRRRSVGACPCRPSSARGRLRRRSDGARSGRGGRANRARLRRTRTSFGRTDARARYAGRTGGS